MARLFRAYPFVVCHTERVLHLCQFNLMCKLKMPYRQNFDKYKFEVLCRLKIGECNNSIISAVEASHRTHQHTLLVISFYINCKPDFTSALSFTYQSRVSFNFVIRQKRKLSQNIRWNIIKCAELFVYLNHSTWHVVSPQILRRF